MIGEALHRDTPTGSVKYFTLDAPSLFLDRKGLQAGFYASFQRLGVRRPARRVVSLLAVFSVVVFHHEHGFRLLRRSFFAREFGVMPLLYRVMVLIGLLSFPLFVLSRIHIIVETSVSLRHV